jgi:hypothetical protein
MQALPRRDVVCGTISSITQRAPKQRAGVPEKAQGEQQEGAAEHQPDNPHCVLAPKRKGAVIEMTAPT